MRMKAGDFMKIRKISFMLCAGLLTGLLSGCGGEYAGVSGENGGVSGGAVSGQAVSENRSEEKKLQWCNDTNLYYYEYDDDENFIIVERNKEDGSERKFTVKNGNGILYVDNEWIYYIRSLWRDCDEETTDQFWRAPMATKGGICHADWKREELILEEDDGIDGVREGNDWIYCNDRWIAYVTGEGEYRQYDMKEKKMVPQTVQSAEEFDACMSQGNARGAIVDFVENTYWLDGSTGKLFPYQDSVKEDIGYYNEFVLSEGICMTDFYQSDEEDNPVFLGTGIDFYHYPDETHTEGWTEQLVSTEEEKALLEKEGFLKYMEEEESWYETVRIFARGQTIYQEIEFRWKEGGVVYKDMVMLSCQLGQKGSLQVDRALTEAMRNPEDNQKVFRKIWGNAGGGGKARFLSNGLCVYMTERYAFLIQSDGKTEEWQLVSYEFDSGKTKVLDKEDEEWYLLYEDRSAHPAEEDYIGAWINYMPDNGGL